MTFEYVVEPDKKPKSLNDNTKSDIVKSIYTDFDEYNAARKSNLDKAEQLSKEIFFNSIESEKSVSKEDKWKAKVKMCKVFMFYQVLKAFIWKNIYSNVNSMFDVSGEDLNSDSDSNKQKAMLVNIFEKMEYPKTADTIIDYSLIYGELISFCGWKKRYEEIRRPISFFASLFQEDIQKLPKILAAIKQGKRFWIDERKIYDNPYIQPVNPVNFVFDVSQKDEWDTCPKILKTFKTPDDIVNNKLYKVTAEQKKAIRDLISTNSKEQNDEQSDIDLINEVTNGSCVEVLEHWGNFRLSDGTILKNWHAVVIARKYLVRFSKNDLIINPFTFGTTITDPDTKRGISQLYSVLNLALTQEDLMNRTYNMQSLNENTPIIAPKGFFEESELKLFPGKVIEIEENLNPENVFKQLQFNSNIFLNDIAFLNDLMSEISGIYPNMAGGDEQKAKTATEITTKTQGQMTRLSMILDTINQYLIIPNVKKVASHCANFKNGIETLFLNKDDKKEVISIDDRVRQQEYKYTYADRTATADRFNKADMIISAIQQFAQFVPLNMPEIFTWYLEQKGVENPERFLLSSQQQMQEAGVGGVSGESMLNFNTGESPQPMDVAA